MYLNAISVQVRKSLGRIIVPWTVIEFNFMKKDCCLVTCLVKLNAWIIVLASY